MVRELHARRITGARLSHDNLLAGVSRTTLVRGLRGRSITPGTRRAKHALIHTDTRILAAQQGMSGSQGMGSESVELELAGPRAARPWGWAEVRSSGICPEAGPPRPGGMNDRPSPNDILPYEGTTIIVVARDRVFMVRWDSTTFPPTSLPEQIFQRAACDAAAI